MQKATIYYGGFAFRGGGAFMHANVLRNELQLAGWDVELITLERLPLPLRFLPHALGKICNLLIPPMGFYYKDRLTGLLYKMLFNRKADLRIFEDVYLSWNSNTPSATLLHAVWSDNLQSITASEAGVKRLVKAEERAIDSITHPIITVSDAYRDFLAKSHAGSFRMPAISVVPLGLELAAFDDLSEPHGADKSLVFCGSLESRKNLRFLLGVFRKLHESDAGYRLTIIGDGPDRADLERYSVQQALPVIFRGRLGRVDVISELRQHSLYVHPSVKESFSFALLEAKLTGLKTVAYKGLEVPAEFIDVPVASFEEADWLAAIRQADEVTPMNVDALAYSSTRMMQTTLALARGSAGEAS